MIILLIHYFMSSEIWQHSVLTILIFRSEFRIIIHFKFYFLNFTPFILQSQIYLSNFVVFFDVGFIIFTFNFLSDNIPPTKAKGHTSKNFSSMPIPRIRILILLKKRKAITHKKGRKEKKNDYKNGSRFNRNVRCTL